MRAELRRYGQIKQLLRRCGQMKQSRADKEDFTGSIWREAPTTKRISSRARRGWGRHSQNSDF